MAQTTVDVDALYAALDQKRQAQSLSWRELARELKISPSTFTRMAQGSRPDVDAFATLVEWLGVPTQNFLRSSKKPGEQLEPDPMAMISSYLRSAKNIAPEDAEALEDIMQAAVRRLLRK